MFGIFSQMSECGPFLMFLAFLNFSSLLHHTVGLFQTFGGLFFDTLGTTILKECTAISKLFKKQ